VQHQQENDEHLIEQLQQQARLANEQIRIDDDLLTKGLVTRQQTITARQQLAAIESEIASHRAHIKQLEAQRFQFQSTPLEKDTEMNSRVFELERSLAEMKEDFEINSSVVSPYGGEVVELKVYPGGTVSAGAAVLSIQPAVNDLEVLAYVPSLRAKEIKVGMEVQVSPSTVKREEYGYIRGKVVQVADYPSTKAALMRNFENESLISALTESGAVTEVKVEMVPDSNTPSGFRWSSSKGPPVLLSAGTLCSMQVVTLRQRPLALVMPFLKHKLGLD
jgi:HlyD family secretion protein